MNCALTLSGCFLLTWWRKPIQGIRECRWARLLWRMFSGQGFLSIILKIQNGMTGTGLCFLRAICPALLYSLLHLTGYNLPFEEIKRFRQWGSKTPGHIEYGDTPGVECTTGPLGQGFGMAVGMAIAERFFAAKFNKPGHEIVNHFTYAIVSDGDLMEGIASEAASLAGHFKLGKLICLYDNNHISLSGETRLTFTEDVCKRFEAYGWHVQNVEDGNDIEAVSRAVKRHRKKQNVRP